jgi:EAL domain-containing protein (putative c-di-GMP-specific phosphodiesterase class I)
MALFEAAEQCGCFQSLELLCRKVVVQAFVAQRLPGKLFLNVSPDCLSQPDYRSGRTLEAILEAGLDPRRVIIELTEHKPANDYGLLGEAIAHYRKMGFTVAIDDLGEGFASLRLWSELRPEFVKIDRHFVQNIQQQPIKAQFLRSIQ